MSLITIRLNPAVQLELWGFDFEIKFGQGSSYELSLLRDHQIIARVSAPRSGGPMTIAEVRRRARDGRFGATSGVHQSLELFVTLAERVLATEAAQAAK
jgi:hypothetical protein